MTVDITKKFVIGLSFDEWKYSSCVVLLDFFLSTEYIYKSDM